MQLPLTAGSRLGQASREHSGHVRPLTCRANALREGGGGGGGGGANICVLGAGVIGLSSAVRLAEELDNVQVTLRAELFGDQTTSHGAAGLWEPYKLGDEQDPTLIDRWGGQTLEHLLALVNSDQAPVSGCMSLMAYNFTQDLEPDPSWLSAVQHSHPLSAAELGQYPRPYAHGLAFSTVICQGDHYLPWLQHRLEQAGGTVDARRLECLEELAGYDLIVNCTGIRGAKQLFNDTSMYPIRGQIVRVQAPWIKACHMVDNRWYVIPNFETVILGGTAQQGDWNADFSEEDFSDIWEGCCAHLPSLRQYASALGLAAKVENHWVGFRPGRSSIRLESEVIEIEGPMNDAIDLKVIHNYGHGGSGVTLHWGCAGDVVAMARQLLR